MNCDPSAGGELISAARAADNNEVGHPTDMENVHCNKFWEAGTVG